MMLPASAYRVIPLTEAEYITVHIVAAGAWTGPECGDMCHPHPSARIVTLAQYLSRP
jgi:hypothetical protein